MVRLAPADRASFAGGDDQTYVSPILEAWVHAGTIDGQITQGSPLGARGCGMYCCHVSSSELLLVYLQRNKYVSDLICTPYVIDGTKDKDVQVQSDAIRTSGRHARRGTAADVLCGRRKYGTMRRQNHGVCAG